MTGAVDAGVVVTKTFMDSLKDQPLSLALVVMNFALIGYVFYESKQFNNTRTANLVAFMDQQNKVTELLARCVVPDRQRTGLPLPQYKLDLIGK